MKKKPPIPVLGSVLEHFCRRHGIRSLALFGSITRPDFGAESDVDVLVDFEPGRTPGLLSLASMGIEMSDWFGGRYVDLKTPGCIRPAMLAKILLEAELQYGPPIGRSRPAASHARSRPKSDSPGRKKQTR